MTADGQLILNDSLIFLTVKRVHESIAGDSGSSTTSRYGMSAGALTATQFSLTSSKRMMLSVLRITSSPFFDDFISPEVDCMRRTCLP